MLEKPLLSGSSGGSSPPVEEVVELLVEPEVVPLVSCDVSLLGEFELSVLEDEDSELLASDELASLLELLELLEELEGAWLELDELGATLLDEGTLDDGAGVCELGLDELFGVKLHAESTNEAKNVKLKNNFCFFILKYLFYLERFGAPKKWR